MLEPTFFVAHPSTAAARLRPGHALHLQKSKRRRCASCGPLAICGPLAGRLQAAAMFEPPAALEPRAALGLQFVRKLRMISYCDESEYRPCSYSLNRTMF